MGGYLIEKVEGKDPLITSPGESFKGLVRELLASGLPLNTHSNVYENVHRVKSGPGYLLGFTVYSSNVAAQFIQVHDTNGPPASGAIPAMVMTVAAASNLAVYFNTPGRAFLTGITLVNSSTGPTYTAGSADTWFDVQFV